MKINKLTAREVASAGVGKGTGTAGTCGWWFGRTVPGLGFQVTRDGRDREMGLGPLEKVPLAAARNRAQKARELLGAGNGPHRAPEG